MGPIKILVITVTLYAVLALAFDQEHQESHQSYYSNELIVSEPEDLTPGNKNYENQGAQVDIMQLVAPTEVPQNKQNCSEDYGAGLKNRDSRDNQTKENQKESQHVQQTQSNNNQTVKQNQKTYLRIHKTYLGLINKTDQRNRGNQSYQKYQPLDNQLDKNDNVNDTITQKLDPNYNTDNDINDNDTNTSNPYPNRPRIWTTCNYETDPTLSCADCNTRIICKQVGALLEKCYNSDRPYCNHGACSATPTDGCAIF